MQTIRVWRPDLGETADTGAEYHIEATGRSAAREAAIEDAEARCESNPDAYSSYEHGVEVLVRDSAGREYRVDVEMERVITFEAFVQ